MFNDFGKEEIKSWGMSPDVFVQMAFQYAYYKLFGHLCPAYESSQIRQFAYGRTEVTRSTSLDVLRWIKSMDNTSRDPDAYRYDLLKAAMMRHVNYMKDANNFRAVDRHLLGNKIYYKHFLIREMCRLCK